MIGKNRCLLSKIKTAAPKTKAHHYVIHQRVLCAKLGGDLKEVMDKKMKIINFFKCTATPVPQICAGIPSYS